MWRGECEVCSVETVKCEVWSGECEVWRVMWEV